MGISPVWVRVRLLIPRGLPVHAYDAHIFIDIGHMISLMISKILNIASSALQHAFFIDSTDVFYSIGNDPFSD